MDVFDATLWEQQPLLRRQQDDAIAVLRGSDKGDLQLFWDAVEEFFNQLSSETVDEIQKLWGPEYADDDQLKVLAWTVGIRLPKGVAMPYLRRWLEEGAAFRSWKGNYDNLAAAIFLATGIPVEVELPFENAWEVGVSEVDDEIFSIGEDYHPEANDTFIVGESEIGDSKIGSEVVGEEVPYTVKLNLFFDPGPEGLIRIEWAASQILRAIDLLDIVIPDEPSAWTLGYSRLGISTRISDGCFVVDESYIGESEICGDPDPADRIILPDGSTIAET